MCCVTWEEVNLEFELIINWSLALAVQSVCCITWEGVNFEFDYKLDFGFGSSVCVLHHVGKSEFGV